MAIHTASDWASTRWTGICTSPPTSCSTASLGGSFPGHGGVAGLAIHGAFLDPHAAETRVGPGVGAGADREMSEWLTGVFIAGQLGGGTHVPLCILELVPVLDVPEKAKAWWQECVALHWPHSCRRRSEPLSLVWRLSCQLVRLGSQPEARRWGRGRYFNTLQPPKTSIMQTLWIYYCFHSEIGENNFYRYAQPREVIKCQPHFSQCA